jgi:hypothetical protein
VLGASMATTAINHPGQDSGATESTVLVRTFAQRQPGTAPDGRELSVPWSRAEFNITLAPRTP